MLLRRIGFLLRRLEHDASNELDRTHSRIEIAADAGRTNKSNVGHSFAYMGVDLINMSSKIGKIIRTIKP